MGCYSNLVHIQMHSQFLKIYVVISAIGQWHLISHINFSAGNGPVSYIIGVDRSIDYFIIGCVKNMTLIRWKIDNNASVSIVNTLTTVDDDRADTRFNDGKIDIAGRFWGGMYIL